MRAYQIPIAILCFLSSMVPVATQAVTTTGICTGTRPTKTDPPQTYPPESGDPQNCFPLATQVSGERVCSDNAPGVACRQRVVQLPVQIFFYVYSSGSRLCEETSRTYFGVDEADDCRNPRAGEAGEE